jgi:CubicO group peptidase (beta-lactamase class C family)
MPARTGLEMRLDELAAAGRIPRLHGLVVMRQGQVMAERYGADEDFKWNEPLGHVRFGPDVLHDIRSATKSVTSLLYGIALDGGRVPEPQAPLLRQFPEYPDLSADPARARLTVEHALTMTLGLEWNEDLPYTSVANSEIAMEMAQDRYRFVLSQPVAEEPGQHWHYCGGATAVIGRLLERGTGEPLPEFARRALFEPLGISAFEWMTGQDGVASSASGLRLATPDLARIGQLVLDHGRKDGRQIVPSGWLETALRRHLRIDGDLGYGYQWYAGTSPAPDGTGPLRWSAAFGNGGQRLYVLPDLDGVVAITAGNYDTAEQSATPSAIMDEAVLPSLSPAGKPRRG